MLLRHPRDPCQVRTRCFRLLAIGILPLLAFGCSGGDGDTGPAGPAGPPGPTTGGSTLPAHADLPGMNITILSVSGGTGPNGNFIPGDTLSVTFTLTQDDGTPIPIGDLDFGAILASGPTFNYQRVLARQSDLASASVMNPSGSFTYTFSTPIPDEYLAPLNDTTSFGAGDGELQGQPLMDGTYTVGIEAYRGFQIEGESFRDAGNATMDFLVGNAAAIEHREVVTIANCNQCHENLRAHGEIRRNVSHCVLCHTAGAEDRNVMTVANGTPGRSIEFRVMIHKLHNAAHLPSVLGVGVNANGSRNYSATPEPYEIVGFGNRVHDFSNVEFPMWPNLSEPMPKDAGYSGLSGASQDLEDTIRQGVTACGKCHGDPDGSGPLPAPAQGDRAFDNPSRRACGSCHDDIDWDLPYSANNSTMPPQPDDQSCAFCHPVSGSMLSVMDAHLHPLNDPNVNPGTNFNLVSVSEAGTNNGDGDLDPGERVQLEFTIKDDTGADIPPSAINRIETVFSGPTSNYNLINLVRIPPAALGSGPNYIMNMPEIIYLESVGTSTVTGSESFSTARTPHLNVSGAETEVRVRTGTGASTTLDGSASALQNFVDVMDATGFVRNDYIAVGGGTDGGGSPQEYLRIQFVDGDRLWFSSPATSSYPTALRNSHPGGAPVTVVTLMDMVEGTDYTINATTGTITEVTEFGAGNEVLVTYVSDFVVPMVYGPPLNDTPDIGEEQGEWTGKTLVDGTYTVGIWGRREVSVNLFSESNDYWSIEPPGSMDVRVGSSGSITPYALISSADNCAACHGDIRFHGSNRAGFGACVLCHGPAGGEDRPQYVAANAPATTGTTINFRRMLHRIHMGAELHDPTNYIVNGFGLGYPNNFTPHTYEHVEFPAIPGGTKHCEKCHGDGNSAWQMPSDRNHPTMQGVPVLEWTVACGSCHNSPSALAHMELKTTVAGQESCETCHGEGSAFDVELMHKTR